MMFHARQKTAHDISLSNDDKILDSCQKISLLFSIFELAGKV